MTALLVAIGLAVWLAPERELVPVTGVAATAGDGGHTPAGSSATSPRADQSFALVIDSNMFSPERVPPRVRFTLVPVASAPPAPVRRAPAGPRVYGITLRSGDPTALIDADPAVPGAEIYRIGDTIGTALIVEINDSTVVLDGPAGRRVLRLETRPKP